MRKDRERENNIFLSQMILTINQKKGENEKRMIMMRIVVFEFKQKTCCFH